MSRTRFNKNTLKHLKILITGNKRNKQFHYFNEIINHPNSCEVYITITNVSFK